MAKNEFDTKETINSLKDIQTFFEHSKYRTVMSDDALRIHENYTKALDRAIEIINKYYERCEE